MMQESSIKYLRNKEIDKSKWNACIARSTNGHVYGTAEYLDHMSAHWDGLVQGDYDAVMPLTWNKKYGIHYLYQPPLTAQLGLFGENPTAEMLASFLDAIPKKFRYWDIYLNHGNLFSLTDYKLYQRRNYELELSGNYEELRQAFRENVKRNIKKANQTGFTLKKGFPVEEVITLAVAQMREETKERTEMMRFRDLYHYYFAREQAMTYGIVNHNKELIASAVFLLFNKRAYYILVGNHPDGKTMGASHALIDAFIKDHAGRNLILDFEGSDRPSLAFFYSGFGAKEVFYPGLKVNKLPGFLKWIKE